MPRNLYFPVGFAGQNASKPFLPFMRAITLMHALRFCGIPLLAAAAVALGTCAGCYDAGALINKVRSEALHTKLAEVDFGVFYTTLPRDPQSGAIPKFEIHFFGTVPHYRVAEIKKQLKHDDFRLRHEVLAAIRACSREELAEPELAKLRARLEKIVNGILEDAPVKDIGFYGITIRHV